MASSTFGGRVDKKRDYEKETTKVFKTFVVFFLKSGIKKVGELSDLFDSFRCCA